jgi:hypothetical protein
LREGFLGKVYHLPQGFDERYLKPFSPSKGEIDLLFMGEERNAGTGRNEWLNRVKREWGDKFVQYRKGVYRENLQEKIREAKIVLAPSEPVKSWYCSNRIYLTTGFGGLILHPENALIKAQYLDKVPLYVNTDHMIYLADGLLKSNELRESLAKQAYQQTTEKHLYRHRVEELLYHTVMELGL